ASYILDIWVVLRIHKLGGKSVIRKKVPSRSFRGTPIFYPTIYHKLSGGDRLGPHL
ncbi:unnamed protein product, partial [marine sediment metagenome]